MGLLLRLRRRIREAFGYREKRYGVRYFSGRYEKLDFTTQDAAEEWAFAHIPNGDWVCFEYTPIDLAIDRNRIRRSEHPTPQ